MNNSPTYASFWIRSLAEVIELLIFSLPFSLFFYIFSTSQEISQLVYGLFLYIIAVGLPLGILQLFYKAFFTSVYGGNLGKLATGIAVIHESGSNLTFKQALFRYTLGYMFSSTLFGLGFAAIFKNSQRKAFHDQATGSKVIIKRNLLPLSAVIILFLSITHGYLLSQSIQKISSGPLPNQFIKLGEEFQQYMKNSQQNNQKNEEIPSKVSLH